MDDAGIFARESDVLGRPVQLGVASGRVISVSFPESVPDDAEPEHPLLDRVFAYLDGEKDDFDDVTLALTIPTDQRRVLDALRGVPYGETASISQLVRLAGLDTDSETDRRLAESAIRANPVPIFVPDHRVDAAGATPSAVADVLRRVES